MHSYIDPPPCGRSGPSFGDTVATGFEVVLSISFVLFIIFGCIVTAPITIPLWIIGKLTE